MSDIDWNSPFKPEDFEPIDDTADELVCTPRESANIANRRFRELLEQAPKCYGQYCDAENHYWHDDELRSGEDTHQARLVNIELLGDSEQLEKK